MHHWIRVNEYEDSLSPFGKDRISLSRESPEQSYNTTTLDVSKKKRKDLKELQVYPNLQILFAHSNMLRNMNFFISLPKLQKIDLAYNSISYLPPKKVWAACTPNLQILYLQNNSLYRLQDCLESLSGLLKLIYLTLFNNPFEEYDRKIIIAKLGYLNALDRNSITDAERINLPLNHKITGKFSILHENTKLPLPQYFENSSSPLHLKAFQVEIQSIIKIHNLCSPSVKIQKVFKGWIVRHRNNKKREIKDKAITKIQKIARGFLFRCKIKKETYILMKKVGIEDCLLDFQSFEKLQATRKLQKWYRIKFMGKMEFRAVCLLQRIWRGCKGRRKFLAEKYAHNFPTRIYFLQRDAEILETLISKITNHNTDSESIRKNVVHMEVSPVKIMSSNLVKTKDALVDNFQKSKLLVENCLLKVSKNSELIQLRDNLVEKEKYSCNMKEIQEIKFNLKKIQMGLSLEKCFSKLILGNKNSGREETLRKLKRKSHIIRSDYVKKFKDVFTSELSEENFQKKRPPLYSYKVDDFYALTRLTCQCNYYNIHILTEPAIKERSAALSIQAAWRAHHIRKNIFPPLIQQLIHYRAVVCIQTWWRRTPCRKRKKFLHHLAVYAKSIRNQKCFFIESSLFQIVSDATLASVLEEQIAKNSFKSHNYFITFINGKVSIHLNEKFVNACRKNIPKWILNKEYRKEAIISKKVRNVSAINDLITKRTIITSLEACLYDDTLHDKEIVKKCFDMGANMIKVEFESEEEAFARAIGLFVITWFPAKSNHAHFFTAKSLLSSLESGDPINDQSRILFVSKWSNITLKNLFFSSSNALKENIPNQSVFKLKNDDNLLHQYLNPHKPEKLNTQNFNNQRPTSANRILKVAFKMEFKGGNSNSVSDLLGTKSNCSISRSDLFAGKEREIIHNYLQFEKRGEVLNKKMQDHLNISKRKKEVNTKKIDHTNIAVAVHQNRKEDKEKNLGLFREERKRRRKENSTFRENDKHERKIKILESKSFHKQVISAIGHEKEKLISSIRKRRFIENEMNQNTFSSKIIDIQSTNELKKQKAAIDKQISKASKANYQFSLNFQSKNAQIRRATQSDTFAMVKKITKNVMKNIIGNRLAENVKRKEKIQDINDGKFEKQRNAIRNDRLLLKNMLYWRKSMDENDIAVVKIKKQHENAMKEMIALVKREGAIEMENQEGNNNQTKDIFKVPSYTELLTEFNPVLDIGAFSRSSSVSSIPIVSPSTCLLPANLSNSREKDDILHTLVSYADTIIKNDLNNESVSEEEKKTLDEAKNAIKANSSKRRGSSFLIK